LESATNEGVGGGTDAAERPALAPALDRLGRGDVLVVTKLDRLSRSLHDFTVLLRRSERDGWGSLQAPIRAPSCAQVGARRSKRNGLNTRRREWAQPLRTVYETEGHRFESCRAR
jgi:Resolvase, N terminal domain